MIVLSVKQPCAQLICAGVKNIENRTWRLPEEYTGKRVLIHASGEPWSWKQFCDYIEQLDNEDLELQKIIMENNFNEEWLESLPTSSIIGSVAIAHCMINNSSIWAEKTDIPQIGDTVLYKNTRGKIKEVRITELRCIENGSIWFYGIDKTTYAKVWYSMKCSLELMENKPPVYNWILHEPILFDKPIQNIKGRLGFWEYELNKNI